ncbi:MAG: hypothetical protein VB111_04465 [Clostridiaceae bacterium]|nr:hypothetical protein [Clostridiaceae bacterium]
MRIVKAELEFIEEPLKAVFAFKGKYNSRPMWNTVVRLTSDSGATATGIANEGILWSDPAVYNKFSISGGSAVMYLITDYACQISRGFAFERPDELLRAIFPRVMEYGQAVSGLAKLRTTFVLGALVALDTAAWLLYAREKGMSFDELIPPHAKPYMQTRNAALAAIPLITYTVSMEDMLREVDAGRFFLKIKIGSDPAHDGDPEKMLAWDCDRLTAIHSALRDIPCAHSDSGHIPYYLDANGRYDSKDRLLRLLDHADRIGMLPSIAILEEPFPEDAPIDVSDLPVRLAADESAHSDADVRARIDMGYRAIALKPIAKTMSMTFDMLAVAGAAGIPCFCADLTVCAAQVDINKNFAARIAPLPGLKVGLLESNGHQYYKNWGKMVSGLPYAGAPWVEPQNGLYRLDDAFYARSGGIFETIPMYEDIL